MSSTLVEAVPLPPHQFNGADLSQQQSDLVISPQCCCMTPVEEPWVAQLASLASQHHTSEYNRIKYGHQGCPIAYVPLSVHLPSLVQELRARQMKSNEQSSWWPSSNVESEFSTPERQHSPLSGGAEEAAVDLQRELSAAISDSLPPTPHAIPNTSARTQVKTSETHPINVSTIIPPESIVAMSSHLTPSTKPSPVMFDIPLAYSLDRVAGYAHLFPSLPSPVPFIPVRSSSTPPAHTPSFPSQNRYSVSEALQAAISSKLTSATQMPPAISKVLSLKSAMTSISRVRPVRDSVISNHSSSKTAGIHRQSTSIAVSVNARRPTSYIHSLPGVLDTVQSIYPGAIDVPKLSTQQIIPSYTSVPRPRSPLISSSSKFRAVAASLRTPSVRLTTPKQFRLGNLYLSSCPGKKVRLNGPVKGRSAVCRNLDIDLRRMKDLGVRCVVCCLDDEELSFLGASWTEYYQTAHRLGLDVLRIPLPEGLAPLSAESLDAHLTRLIDTYTLHGMPILVHCRGGVGRAGLVACCWMLKLGLCGWIETDIRPASLDSCLPPTDTHPTSAAPCPTPPQEHVHIPATSNLVRHDTLQLVERAILVVRRRRSVKAIETLEQVKFLVDFVEYLRLLGAKPPNQAQTQAQPHDSRSDSMDISA